MAALEAQKLPLSYAVTLSKSVFDTSFWVSNTKQARMWKKVETKFCWKMWPEISSDEVTSKLFFVNVLHQLSSQISSPPNFRPGSLCISFLPLANFNVIDKSSSLIIFLHLSLLPLSYSWSFSHSCWNRLVSWWELGSQEGSTTDHLSNCCLSIAPKIKNSCLPKWGLVHSCSSNLTKDMGWSLMAALPPLPSNIGIQILQKLLSNRWYMAVISKPTTTHLSLYLVCHEKPVVCKQVSESSSTQIIPLLWTSN